jgi:hypothetical protein
VIVLRGHRLKSSPGEKPHFTNVRHVRLVRYGNTLAGIRRMRLDSGTMRNNSVIKPTSFVPGAHPSGPLIAVMVGDHVAVNLRIDAQTAHALYRAVAEALRAQEVLNAMELARQRMVTRRGATDETR